MNLVQKISRTESDRLRFILFGFLAVTLVSIFFTPSDLVAEMFPDLFKYESSCIMLNIAGIPCPFCGMSRAWKEFTRMNFSAAIYYNPSSIAFFAIAGITVTVIFVLSLFNYKIRLASAWKTLLAMTTVLSIIWILNILYGHHF
jgi:hypothetical protein